MCVFFGTWEAPEAVFGSFDTRGAISVACAPIHINFHLLAVGYVVPAEINKLQVDRLMGHYNAKIKATRIIGLFCNTLVSVPLAFPFQV